MAGNQRVSTRATGVVGLAILCSRVLGLLREVVFASLFGASKNMDAFLTAFRAPNMLRDLFAEGALSTAFVTTFSQRIAKEGDQSAWKLASKVATLTVIFMSALTLVGVIFAPAVIAVLAPGFAPDKAELTILLTRIMFPFILLVSLAALVMGMLNAKNVFGMPAMASSFFNLGSIIGGAGFGWLLDPHFGSRALIGLALGTLVGGLLQLLVQVPSLAKVGFKFRPDLNWHDPGVRNILILMGPATIAASAVQINVAVNSGFASSLGDGPMTWLNYALGLAGYSGVKVLAPAFYAINKRNLPMLVSLFSIAMNFGLNWFFRFQLGFGHRGLALSTSFVAITNFLLLYIMMRRYTTHLETAAMLVTLAKLAVAGAALALVCVGTQWIFFQSLQSLRIWQKAIEMIVTVALGCAVFFGAAYVLRVAEVHDVVLLVKRRLRS